MIFSSSYINARLAESDLKLLLLRETKLNSCMTCMTRNLARIMDIRDSTRG